MKKRSKKIKKIILIICLITIIAIISKYKNIDKDTNIYMLDINNKNINTVYELLDDYNLEIETTYEYHDTIKKNYVISQSIEQGTIINEQDKLTLVISKGKLDLEQLKNDKINELGKVPIRL